jgi:transcriptional regulator GlxA family with amidase domain
VAAADEAALLLAEVVGHIAGDHSITWVSQVAALAQMSVRNLQRAFADYVGAGP